MFFWYLEPEQAPTWTQNAVVDRTHMVCNMFAEEDKDGQKEHSEEHRSYRRLYSQGFKI